jgi:hypothetical protein
LAIQELQPRLVWISRSHLDDPGAFASEFLDLHRQAHLHRARIILGGRALTPELRKLLPPVYVGTSMEQLAALASELHSRPSLPRRGRPPG